LHVDRRTVRREQDDPARGVQRALVLRVSLRGQPEDEIVVRGKEHLERRALYNLAEEIPRRPVRDCDGAPGVACEGGRDLVQRELQVGGCGDIRRIRIGGLRGGGRQGRGREKHAAQQGRDRSFCECPHVI